MRTILNIAHRGYTREFPDNTLESCRAAIDLGVDAIEFDVHETADHSFVVLHDDKLQGKYVARLPLCDVQDIKRRECKIPTLEEALDLCRGRAKLLVELKQVQSLERLLSIFGKIYLPEQPLAVGPSLKVSDFIVAWAIHIVHHKGIRAPFLELLASS